MSIELTNLTFARSAALGVVAGMRSQMPLALLSYAANHGRFPTSGPPLSILSHPATQAVTAIAAAGELVGDKLPMTPSRLERGPLFGRLVIGSVAGAAIAKQAGQPWLGGAIAGASGAAVGAFAGYHLRRALGRATRLPDPLFGAAEDAFAIGLGSVALGLR